jgi:tetratricopeptide (TPR) repeat protein
MNYLLTVYRALECHPDTYRDWYDQGNILKERMDYFGALISYEKALEYYPDDYWAWYKRGMILEDLGMYEEAAESYSNAAQVKDDNYWALVRSRLCLSTGIKGLRKSDRLFSTVQVIVRGLLAA